METGREGVISRQKEPVSLEDVVDNVKVGVAPPPKKARMDYVQTRELTSQSVTMHSPVGSITDHQAPPVEQRDCKVNSPCASERYSPLPFSLMFERFFYSVKLVACRQRDCLSRAKRKSTLVASRTKTGKYLLSMGLWQLWLHQQQAQSRWIHHATISKRCIWRISLGRNLYQRILAKYLLQLKGLLIARLPPQ